MVVTLDNSVRHHLAYPFGHTHRSQWLPCMELFAYANKTYRSFRSCEPDSSTRCAMQLDQLTARIYAARWHDRTDHSLVG
jgi:hypothetical protein